MEAPLLTLPTVRDTVDQSFSIEPLGGPQEVFYYLDRFPDDIYHKSPDTHLYKLMRSMLGESGVNWIRKNTLEARLLLEDMGIDLFDLDRFFGNVFQFGRIVDEMFDADPYGLIPKDQWEVIKGKNARYRNRALDYITGARAGNTPFGMRLVARAGLGYDVEIIENYKYLYDQHSDDPLGIAYMGKTASTEEMVVVPRRELGGASESTDELYSIPPADQYHLQQAVDRIRPQTTIMTLRDGRGMRERNNWKSLTATSEYTEVLRYVTGSSRVAWPTVSSSSWIESGKEKEAPRIADDLQQHYTGFHNVATVTASSSLITPNGAVPATNALADYAEPLTVTSATELNNGKALALINGVYPTTYQDLPGVPDISYQSQSWSSAAREGEEALLLQFSGLEAINYLAFDILKVPVRVDIEYDAYDEESDELFVPVTPSDGYSNVILETVADGENPWASLGLGFTNRQGNVIFTRSLKIRLIRLESYAGPVQVKNLRVGRSAA